MGRKIVGDSGSNNAPTTGARSKSNVDVGMGRGWYILFLVYFVVHIPTTILIDAQCLLVGPHYPQPLQDVMSWYLNEWGDPFMASATSPVWFKALVTGECLLQLPFFFVATYAFINKRNWIRIPGIMYCAHVMTTMLPILAEMWLHAAPTPAQRTFLVALYCPYLLVPLMLLCVLLRHPLPFGGHHPTHGSRSTATLTGQPKDPQKTA
eukprot:TRINITY_DN15176_c0_g1_i1.p1 TRINITY_DN15176_c0_g1~~TRINITY_DN15176_c0_g1_i1.p1  ORF type:complete len:208 (+),score=16.71 TRINITY_DN15176_c0_g1_i1:75-698(+)